MVDLYRFRGSAPAPLPTYVYDANGNAYSAPFEGRVLADAGFIIAPPRPADTETQTAEWSGTKWEMVGRPATPPTPAPQPLVLGKLQFIGLAQQAGGMTDTMLVTAYKASQLEAFWVKYQMASSVERDHEVTKTALAALQGLGFLPKGAAAVIAAWPST